MKNRGVETMYSVENADIKCSVAERFIRTMREMLNKLWEQEGSGGHWLKEL